MVPREQMDLMGADLLKVVDGPSWSWSGSDRRCSPWWIWGDDVNHEIDDSTKKVVIFSKH